MLADYEIRDFKERLVDFMVWYTERVMHSDSKTDTIAEQIGSMLIANICFINYLEEEANNCSRTVDEITEVEK